jgi:hypothetical protein
MNFNFKMFGNIDVDHLKDKLNGLDWDEHTIRQNLHRAHKDTQTLEVMWDMESLDTDKIGKTHPNYYKLDMESFIEKVKPVYESYCGDGYFVRILFVKLRSNSNILTHVDSGDGLINCKRTHIPIITNSEVTFTIAGETKHLKEGEIWEIDNTKEHSVNNNSNVDRIHLLMDYKISNKKIKTLL